MCIELCTLFSLTLLGICNLYMDCFGGGTDIYAQTGGGSGCGIRPELLSSA